MEYIGARSVRIHLAVNQILAKLLILESKMPILREDQGPRNHLPIAAEKT